ncbi:tyrosine-type recombinase/integrase [Lactonifactor sp. BIOML-A3]|uniref:tyrosine-type recombinase/integrase n=1 Tax=unclassified Lactonifactor TaxID=2636670 RepID=UPI0012B05B21|nr:MULTISPECIES: tyrosine-type recombinase/integrase [unclassified Lactonifactor]MSA02202.1 tyrosine-type recombinase/integrase [Lactonifactor sp. BIOML-A5]MSA07987.1 tyrosine-type recombinase/integrase [Lactonifactor sp. BIOML-A4]MSA12603.1 tyrosine-type recombinase/integrase [Lactonifactor sp. BIOML-A3]MSA16696.1 tyrosine-type recombinase/integrase [Lactonifactor sp. BIOML-A2]MSA37605.1 tyrosine-type recombinase/integrase [Lactonifactor sp. BIOML-A1]
MGKVSNEIKKRLISEIISETELENIMAEYQYYPLQSEDEDNITKFTNYSSQIWIKFERDEENSLFVTEVSYVTKEKGEATKVDPFHSFEDLNKVLKYFFDNGQYHHWLISCLMVSLGRRVGDTMALKWSDLYAHNGKFRVRLTTLKEEKTGKNLGVRLHQFAQNCITEYCRLEKIKPLTVYDERIFSIGTAAYRSALKKAVQEVGIEYPCSSHSFRKFYGNMMYKLHPQDSDSIKMVQFMFGHSSEDITKGYIGAIDEKIDRYTEDYSDYLKNCMEGKDINIDKSPVISIKYGDLRVILQEALTITSEKNDIAAMNQLLSMVEEMRVS